MYGLKDETVAKIKDVFSQFRNIEKVIIYGSRAKGNYKNGSDIDLVLVGKKLTLKNSIYPVSEMLEELYLPYTFDISIYDHVDNQDLIDHIERVGQIFYSV